MQKLAIVALLAPLAACATITRGSTTAFVVETEPSGAHVTLSTGQTCDATPCTFARVERDSEFSVTISAPGFRTTTHAVTHRTASGGGLGMAGNVLVGGIIGGVVDANSGATQDLVPNPLRVVMTRENGSAAAPAAAEPDAAVVANAPAVAAPPAPAATVQPSAN